MYEEELLSLDRVLVENAQKDFEGIESTLMRKALNTILVYSFGEENVGASRNDIVLGVLRPGMNINDVDSALINLPKVAPHVWVEDGRYVIKHEANIITLIHNRAVELIKRGEIKDALEIIKGKLKKDRSYIIYHPNTEFSEKVEDVDRLRIVISLKALNKSEIEELYKDKTYANRLILYIPKKGDLTKNDDLLVIAERLHLSKKYEKEVSGESKKLLKELEMRDGKLLREKLSEIFGSWVKITSFKPGNIEYRLINCNINEIRAKVKASYDIETIKDGILEHLEGKENGIRLDDIKYDFKITPGKPIIIDDNSFNEALKSLYKEGKIVVEYKGKYLHVPEPLPLLKDDMKVILKEYAPPPERVIEIEKEAKPEIGKGVGEVYIPEQITVKPREEKEILLPIRTLETDSHKSPFSLSYEIERKVRENAQIRRLELILSESSFNNFNSLSKFINSLKIKNAKFVDVKMKIIIERPMDKKEIMKLIDELPPSLSGGKIKAIIEVSNLE